jgi:hypothetical protein
MIERKHFTGGIDAESAPDFIALNDYIAAQNCRMQRNESGDGLAFKPVNGTTLRLSHENVLPKFCIRSVTDEAKGRIYFFMYHGGTGLDHTIWAWDRKTNTGYRVLRSSQVEGGLSFDRNFPITGAALIGDDLYWTDDKSRPRRVNVERGIKTNNPAYISQDGTTPDPYELQIKQTDLTVARRQPKLPPDIVKVDSSDVADLDDIISNRIANESFQFAYRYRSRSSEYSTFSPYSKIARVNLAVSRNDAIRVSLPKDEPIENEIYDVEFLVRSGNTGSWYIFDTYSRRDDNAIFEDHNDPSGAAMSAYFIGDKLTSITDAESGVLFHDVPKRSKSLEIAQNRLFLANNLKGNDYAKSVGLSATFGASVNPAVGWTFGGAEYILVTAECVSTGLFHSVVLVKLTLPVELAGYYYLNLGTGAAAAFSGLSLPSALYVDSAPFTNLFTGVVAKVAGIDELVDPDDYYDLATELLDVSGCGGYGGGSLIDTTYGGDQPKMENISSTGESGIVIEDSIFKVGLVYFDEYGVSTGVTPSDVVTLASGASPVVYDGIDFLLPSGPNLNIPESATHYSIVRTENIIKSSFVKGATTDVKYAKDSAGELDFTDTVYDNTNTLYVAVSIERLVGEGIGYNYQQGDALVLYRDGSAHRMEILGVQGYWVLCEAKDVGDTSTITHLVFTIYTPKRNVGEDSFFEVGETHLILNPGTPTREFSVTSGTIAGDAVLMGVRSDGIAGLSPYNTIWFGRMSPNNKYWSQWDTDIGRINAVLFSKEVRYETEVAWGGVYFPGTESNDLNAFLSGDIKTLDDAVGGIQKLIFTSRTQEYGNVLLAIGKSEAASLYLGRVELYNANEGSSVVSSASVIGTVNVLRGGFGTLNPESVVENDGDVYWFSVLKAAVVRYNRNGLVPISDYKFGPVAKWLANKVLLAETNVDFYLVVGGFDEYNKEYLLTTPVDSSRRFPFDYEVLEEMDEEVAITYTGGINYQATLEAGDIYKLTVTTNDGQTVSIGLTDLYFGASSYTSASGTEKSVQFFAPTTGVNTITIGVIGLAAKSITLVKQRLNPYVVINRVPKTFAFNEKENRWTAIYNFVPDWYGKIADVLVSFKNAMLYTHDDTVNVSKFYNIPYKSWFAFVASQPMNLVKRYQGVSLETDEAPDYVHIRTELPNIQSSDIIESEFSELEGVPYASFRKDGLSPNVSGTRFDKQAKGDDIVGRYAKILVEYAKNTKFVTRMVNIISRQSHGHKT